MNKKDVTHGMDYCAVFNVSAWFSCRSVEATGRTEAHGGDAQSGDAKEEGDAAQVSHVKLVLIGTGVYQILTELLETWTTFA